MTSRNPRNLLLLFSLLGILSGGPIVSAAARARCLTCLVERTAVTASEVGDDSPLARLASESIDVEVLSNGALPADPAERHVGPVSLTGVGHLCSVQGDIAPPTRQRLYCIWRI